jgi:hypothetical protein
LDYPLKTGFSRTHTLVPRLQLRLAGRGQLSFTLFSFSCGEVHGQCTSMLLAEHGAIMNLLPPTYVASMYVKVLSTLEQCYKVMLQCNSYSKELAAVQCSAVHGRSAVQTCSAEVQKCSSAEVQKCRSAVQSSSGVIVSTLAKSLVDVPEARNFARVIPWHGSDLAQSLRLLQ